MKHIVTFFATLLIITSPLAALANHCSEEHRAQAVAQAQSGNDHGAGMAAAGSMLDLGTASVDGVKGMAHMKDVRASMAKMGMKTTHHFMVMFSDEKSGKAIESGTVAVKITSPDGTVTGPMELMGMAGHFGADVILDQPGSYTFQVGSKLTDGQTRQFEFKSVIK
jgi:hypothetical protein